jgi:hypothetical protein
LLQLHYKVVMFSKSWKWLFFSLHHPLTLTHPLSLPLPSPPPGGEGTTFIHRFGSSLNEHTHFHCCILEGVFQPAAKIGETSEATDAEAGVVFHAATELDAAAIAQVQAKVRQRILRAFVRRGLIDKSDGEEMGNWEHGGVGRHRNRPNQGLVRTTRST